jgi:hypothetical protein
MKKHLVLGCCVLVSTLMPVWAQDSMTAVMKGRPNGDRGKCTIEVNVDDVAEVEVIGNSARIRTLSGQPSQFRRFECNSMPPRRPNDFRFTGIDGRGRMTLVRDPRNGGPAVIRIEDTKGGYEGYTFDLEWRGGSDDYGRPGYGNGPGYGPGYGDNRPGYGDNRPGYGDNRPGYGDHRPGYNRPGYGNGAPYIVTCSSDDGRKRYCQANTARGVRIVREYNNACQRDKAWGFDSRGIWVDRGCRADFEVQP